MIPEEELIEDATAIRLYVRDLITEATARTLHSNPSDVDWDDVRVSKQFVMAAQASEVEVHEDPEYYQHD